MATQREISSAIDALLTSSYSCVRQQLDLLGSSLTSAVSSAPRSSKSSKGGGGGGAYFPPFFCQCVFFQIKIFNTPLPLVPSSFHILCIIGGIFGGLQRQPSVQVFYCNICMENVDCEEKFTPSECNAQHGRIGVALALHHCFCLIYLSHITIYLFLNYSSYFFRLHSYNLPPKIICEYATTSFKNFALSVSVLTSPILFKRAQ